MPIPSVFPDKREENVAEVGKQLFWLSRSI